MEEAPCRWYLPNKEDEFDEKNRAGALLNETADIEQRQCAWHGLNLWNSTLYTNRELVGFRWGETDSSTELWPTNLRTENIVEEIGEAMLSKASSSPLRPALDPVGADWEVEQAVREADKFVFGAWRQTDAENACVESFLDAYTSGLGCVRVGFDSAKTTAHVESVFFDNLVIDNRECGNRAPPRTYRVRQVMPRASIESHYGVDLGPETQYPVEYRTTAEGWTPLVEAWRLPDAKGRGGRHVVAAGQKLLIDEPWKHDWVPLVFFHWQDRTSGYFCKSGVEQLVPYQVRLNDLNDAIELSQDIVCRPRLLVNANSMIDVQQWDNEAGRMLMYAGTKPEPFEWRTNLVDLYHERVNVREQAKAHVGMSEMFANAVVPDNVRMDSSAGIREFRNMEDARHLRRWGRFEKFRLDVARTLMRVLATSDGADSYTAIYDADRTAIEVVPYEALKLLDKTSYTWTLAALPLSAMSPAAKKETIRDWTSRGLIDDSEERRMEGSPDLERTEDLEMSSIEDIHRHLKIVENGGYEAPTEITNLTYGVKRFVQNYHRLKRMKNVKKTAFENHLRWIVTATSIQKNALAMQAQQQMANQAQPFMPTQAGTGPAPSMGPRTLIQSGNNSQFGT